MAVTEDSPGCKEKCHLQKASARKRQTSSGGTLGTECQCEIAAAFEGR